METIKDIITINNLEGKMLLAAIAIITTLPGYTMKSPDYVLKEIEIHANHMFFPDELISIGDDEDGKIQEG